MHGSVCCLVSASEAEISISTRTCVEAANWRATNFLLGAAWVKRRRRGGCRTFDEDALKMRKNKPRIFLCHVSYLNICPRRCFSNQLAGRTSQMAVSHQMWPDQLVQPWGQYLAKLPEDPPCTIRVRGSVAATCSYTTIRPPGFSNA